LFLFEIPGFVFLVFLKSFFLFFVDIRNFFHQILDLADHLVSVGLVNIGAEGDLPLLAGLRYGGNSEHLGRELDSSVTTREKSGLAMLEPREDYNARDITTSLTARHASTIKW